MAWPTPVIRYVFDEATGTTVNDDIAGEDLTITAGVGSAWSTDAGGVDYDFAGTGRAKSTTRTDTGAVFSALNNQNRVWMEVVFQLAVATTGLSRGVIAGIQYGEPTMDNTAVLDIVVFDGTALYGVGVRGTVTVDGLALTGGEPDTNLHVGHVAFDATLSTARLRALLDGVSIGTATMNTSDLLDLTGQTAVFVAADGTNQLAQSQKVGWLAFYTGRLTQGVMLDRAAALAAAHDTAPATPVVVWEEASAVAVSADGGTTVAPVYTVEFDAGDGVLVLLGQKPTTAGGGTAVTPDDFTLVGEKVGGGYGATTGADVGDTRLYAFWKEADGSEDGATLTITVGDNEVCWAQIHRLSKDAALDWDIAVATAEDTAGGNVALTFASDPGVEVDDYIVAAMCIPTDVTTPTQFSANAFTQTGVTFGTVFEVAEPDSTTGDDIGGLIARGRVTAGPGSAAPSWTATAGGTTTNVRGPGLFVRIRATEDAPVAPADFMPTAAGDFMRSRLR